MWTKLTKSTFRLAPLKQHRGTLILAGLIVLAALLWPAHHARRFAPARGDVAGFTRACVTRTLHGDPVKPACQSLAAIQKTYGVNALVELGIAQGARIMTARRIARGDLLNQKDYRACVARGECAEIPLDGKNSAAFWHLVNSGSITAADCAALPICQALLRLQLIPAPPP